MFLIVIPGCFITPYSCERFGRKKTVWVNTLFASLSCLAVAFIPSSGSVRFVRLLLAVVAKCLISIGNQFQTITDPVIMHVSAARWGWTMDSYIEGKGQIKAQMESNQFFQIQYRAIRFQKTTHTLTQNQTDTHKHTHTDNQRHQGLH